MAEGFDDLLAELHKRIERSGPPPDDEERQTPLALEDMKRTVQKLILQGVSLQTLELSLLYHWLHIATLNRFITDPEFQRLASDLDMVAERLIATLKQTAAGIKDDGPSAAMRERGEFLEQLKAALGLYPTDRLPHAEVVRQTELTNRDIWLTISEWLMKEMHPTIIEGTLLYHLVRTSTIHANVPEEFFQKLERNWPRVMEQVGTLVDQLMQGCGDGVSNVHRFLPRLTVNRRFMSDFLAARTPCFALGLVEERRRPCGFMALRPDEAIPPGITEAGFRFGHSLLGNADYEVIHFAFEFYGFKRYNVLVNPGNPLVKAVLSTMVESGDYFFFAVSDGTATSFRSEIGQKDMAGLETNFPRILRSATTDAQYRKAVSAFEKNPDPPGTMLHWVCRDGPDYLDLTRDRLELNPA